MKGENGSMPNSSDSNEGGTVYMRINIPELKIQKCLQFQLDDSVWQAKQRILATFAKDLKDGLNYGLYSPPSNGRAGKFLDEERMLREYPLQGPIGFLEFKYKRRVYKLLQINQRKIKQLHTKANLKQFLDYVRAGNVEKISKYTSKGLDPNYHDSDTGETPLTVSVTLENDKVKSVIVSLVSGGAHLDFRNRLGLTSLHKAAIRGNVEAVRTLLDLGAAPNYKDGRGLTPLYYSTANNTDGMCLELLLHDRAIIGTPDEQGWFEIHHACRHGCVQHLELLIFYGADMDVQNASGNTPLHVCAVNNQESCARVLLFRGATKEIFNYSNQVPYQVAIIAGNFGLAEIIKKHKPENVVPFRQLPSYSSRRKTSTVTSSMRAVMRCRSDPRLNILTWEKESTEQSPTPEDSQSNSSWKGYNSDSPRLSICSSSSSGLVTSIDEQRFWEGPIGNQDGEFNCSYNEEQQIRPRSGSLGDIGEDKMVNRNTLATLIEGRACPRTVVLQKGQDGFGFVLRGAKSKNMPVSSLDFHPTMEYPALQYLDSVDLGSTAERAGLKSGDFILEINGNKVIQASHERVVELIKASGDTLQLKVITVKPPEKNWYIYQDGCMTLPSRGRAPRPPKRDPNTSLSYSKGRSKSFADGLAEIEKLDETLAQYDHSYSKSMTGLDDADYADPKVASIRSRHAAKRVSCIDLEAERTNNEHQAKETPPVPPKKYASPSELRIQRYHKKYQQGTLEKAKSTPDLVSNKCHEESIYATPMISSGNGPLLKNNGKLSSNGYKTVLNIGSVDSDSSTSTDSLSEIAGKRNRSNLDKTQHFTSEVSSLQAVSSCFNKSTISQEIVRGSDIIKNGLSNPNNHDIPGLAIPPPPRKPAPQPPVKSEVIKINTNGSIYANVSAHIQATQIGFKSPYESSFRPGTNAKVTKDPEIIPASLEQVKLYRRKGSSGSLQNSEQYLTADKSKFLSFPGHGHDVLETEKTSMDSDGHRSVSFAADRVYEKAASFMASHPNANLIVTSDLSSSERGKLSKGLYEPEPDYDADSDDNNIISYKHDLVEKKSDNCKVFDYTDTTKTDIPSHIKNQTNDTTNTSVTITSINEPPKPVTEPSDVSGSAAYGNSLTHGNALNSQQQENPAHLSQILEKEQTNIDSPNIFGDQIKKAAQARENRKEGHVSNADAVRSPQIPPAPAIPAAPTIPAAPAILAASATPAAPPLPHVSNYSTSNSKISSSAGPSLEEIQSAVRERQVRIQKNEFLINERTGNENITKKPLGQTQAAILAAVARRRSVLEQTSDKDIVNQIESKLSKTKKLQSVKYYASESLSKDNADTKSNAPLKDPHGDIRSTNKLLLPPLSLKNEEKAKISSDFLTLAEKARQEYLQKKESGHNSKTIPAEPPTVAAKSPFISTDHRVGSDKDDVTIKDKIRTFEKKLDLSSSSRSSQYEYAVRGVTEDHSYTDGDAKAIAREEEVAFTKVTPPPDFSDTLDTLSEDLVQIEIIPPPAHFAGDDHTGQRNSNVSSVDSYKKSTSTPTCVSSSSAQLSEHGELANSNRSNLALNPSITPPPIDFSDHSMEQYEPNPLFIPPPLEFQVNNKRNKSQDKSFFSKAVSEWNCVDVLDWLESLNMLQYKSTFARQCIDGKRLVQLNRNDYIELGVTQVGHRMSIERSIKKLALQKSN